MSLDVRLLGRPAIESEAGAGYRFRSRKSWALLAYLILGERPPARSHLAALLFDGTDDPLRALRWNLSEIRRALGPDAVVEGDPVVLRLPAAARVDVDVVATGSWQEAVALPGLGSELLESLTVSGSAGFDSWLLAERSRLSSASEAILHEAALGLRARGALDAAIACAVRASSMSPLDENHQALVIRLYRRAGDDRAAQQQYAAFAEVLRTELGTHPGPAVVSALRDTRAVSPAATDLVSIGAIIEAGSAAVSAGAAEAGVASLRTAVQLADASGEPSIRVAARQSLAEALIHSIRGRDEEGLSILHATAEIAREAGDQPAMAAAHAELGYVDFLRARYDRAEFWLNEARDRADGSPWIIAKATTYVGSVESDRGEYPRALAHLDEAVALSRAIGDRRREAYAVAMTGRVRLLRGEWDEAVVALDRAVRMCEDDHWLAFLPWPQAMRGEVELARGDVPAAAGHLEQAFARACHLGDPCWEGMAARGLALVHEAAGQTQRAFDVLADAAARSSRVSDPYVWLTAYILDAQCELGLRHAHPATAGWIRAMQTLASRTAMREMTVRALLHAAASGVAGAAEGAALLAEAIDNPALLRRVAARGGPGVGGFNR